MQNKNFWLKVDNAGKVFPAVSSYSRSSTFRLSMYLNNAVDPVLLQKALDLTLPRFEPFCVKIKSGLFWNYFSYNNNPCIIEEETSHIGQYAMKNKNQYCFRVLYYERRISLETFHAISDGSGASLFLHSLVYEYLKLQGENFESEGKILLNKPSTAFESLDSFVNNSNSEPKKGDDDPVAYQLRGDLYPNYWSSFIKVSINLDEFKKVIKENNCSLTMYIAALHLYAMYQSQPLAKKSKKPLILMIPVNLRNHFPSSTLRNFSLFIKVKLEMNNNSYSFEEVLSIVKEQFEKQLNKDYLQKRINFYVAFEKNFAIRILPLFIKNIAFKIIYGLSSNRVSTSYISNIGKIDLPTKMYDYVTDVDFINSGEKLYMTLASIKNKLNIMFSSRLMDHSIIFFIIKHLQALGLDIVVQTNHMEEEKNEIL